MSIDRYEWSYPVLHVVVTYNSISDRDHPRFSLTYTISCNPMDQEVEGYTRVMVLRKLTAQICTVDREQRAGVQKWG